MRGRLLGRGQAKARVRKVPDLLGLTVDEARPACQASGFLLTEPETEYGPTNGFDAPIVRQRPPADTVGGRGDYVMVWTSGSGGVGGVREPRIPPRPTVVNSEEAERPSS
jgi:hypothetical protein